MSSSPTPEIFDEKKYTHWAPEGQWHAWNGHSPEVEVVTFIADLIDDMNPNNIVETGCGQGYFCRVLPQRALHYESMDEYRQPYAQPEQTPPFRQIVAGDFFILDSDSPWREREMVWWAYHGKPGSWCFVHDTGNGHPRSVYHSLLGDLVKRLDVPGWFFDNPRGSWLGVHP